MPRQAASRWATAIAILAALAFTAAAISSCKVIKVAETGGGVHGSVFVAAVLDEKNPADTTQIFLPDIEVSLFSLTGKKIVATETTDYYGRYMFPRQVPGNYELRWKQQHGWAAGKYPGKIEIKSETRFPTSAEIRADREVGVLFGRVTFADGRTPWSYDESFVVNNTATVTILDVGRTKTLAGPVHANVTGLFAVAGLRRAAELTIRTKNEASSITRVVSSSVVSSGGPAQLVTVELPNRVPELVDVVPQVGGTPIKTAAPGDVIRLDAVTRDADGDPLTFSWEVLPGNGTLTPSGQSTQWKLPDWGGQHSAYLQVADGRGGYARQRIDFTSNLTHVTFSGRAVEKGLNTPIANASVNVNGDPTTTNATGFFSVSTGLKDRYVMNIEKTGYALFARVVDAPLTGQTWEMVKTTTQQVDPTRPINISDSVSESKRHKIKGMRVRVPANALVDGSGNAPSGVLTAHLATLDISDGEAPGDWGGIVNGQENNLISYGAGFVEFVDASGKKYNLKPGLSAEVELFAPPAMLTAAPTSTPTWSYNPKSGYWEINGHSDLNAANGSFVNKVSHFSALNTDVAKTNAACLGVMIYPPIPTGVKLRVKDPTGAVFSQAFEFVLDAGINAVYRLPANTDVSLELLNADGSAYNSTVLLEEVPGTPLSGNVVNTGTAIPAGQSLWPPEPYVPPCKLVILREANEPTATSFLAFKGVGDAVQANNYYAAVDPTNVRKTLRGWWETNGFQFADVNGNGVDDADFLQPPTNAVRTSYLNYNDLGSGRDMYFLKRADGSVAAYVTNYGLFNQDHANADLAANRNTPGATVCMEWSAVEAQSPARIVKFFVYAGNDFGPNATRQTSADLDGFGAKFVPNLCLNCHGGSYDLPTPTTPPTFADINMGASFRELDIATFKFPGGQLTADATEKAAFKQQDLIVRGANGETVSAQVIKDLIDGWYAAGTDDQDNSFTPVGFSGSPENTLYQDVIRNSCRTCHIAQGSDIDWTDYQKLKGEHGLLKSFVLCEGRIMPHAVITYRNFWLSSSPHRPASLRNYQDGSDWAVLGPCH